MASAGSSFVRHCNKMSTVVIIHGLSAEFTLALWTGIAEVRAASRGWANFV
jgi:hypothetical protein